ncbi:DUF2892 domain-containing protein [Candidatus Uhrbacteria bacterium]|nr:DUF2892 domain-containing protein [Candidatus Uhrbacteria bacterium]
MPKQNLGRLDRILRFALAVWWLGPWAPIYGNVWIDWVMFVVAWIALIESFTAWCWLHTALEIDNKDQ